MMTRRTQIVLGVLVFIVCAGVRSASARVVAIRAQPDIVVLGVDKRVVLEINADAPLRGIARLSATDGQIGRAESLGGGRYRALYHPPKEGSPPQIVLIAFWDSADVSTLGHVAIPIHANLTMQLESAPGATVVVDVGNHRSSPAVGNAKGDVTVTVRVAPGVTKATIHTSYPNGRRAVSEDAINVPPWNRVQLIVGASEVLADGRSPVPVRVIALTRGGRVTARGIQLGATLGRIIHPGNVDGYLAATYIPRARALAATEKISASLSGDRRSLDVRTIDLKPIEPYDITVQGYVQRVSEKDADARFIVRATLRSRQKIAIPGERLAFASDPHVGNPRVRELGNGKYEASFTVPKAVEPVLREKGKARVKVSHDAARGSRAAIGGEAEVLAKLLGLGAAVAVGTKVEREVLANGSHREAKAEDKKVKKSEELESAPPVEVGLHLKPETIRGNAGTAHIVVHLFDEEGKPVSGKKLSVEASSGRVVKVVEKNRGYYFVEYRTPTYLDKKGAELPVRISVASDDGAVGYSEMISVETALESDFPVAEKRFHLGAVAGGWIPFGTAFGFAVDIDFLIRLKIFDGNFHVLFATGAYFPQASSALDPQNPAYGPSSQRQRIFPLVGGVVYRRVVGRPWFSLHAGLTVGAYIVDEEETHSGVQSSQQSFLPGFQVPFGLEFKVGPGTIPLALRYHHSVLRQGGTITGSVQAFTIATGYRMEF